MTTKTALITGGASRGIGKAIALALANNGYDLVITCQKNLSSLKGVADSIRKQGVRCLALQSDAASFEACQDLFEEVSKFSDSLDLIVNNAATSSIGLITDMTKDEWDAMLHTNLSSLFHTSKFAIPMMLKKSPRFNYKYLLNMGGQ